MSKTKEKNVSIKDVAKEASVSITTVSRILNNIDYPVSNEARKRVEKAIKDLGYIPNKAAQNLRKNETRTIGLIVRDIGDPYFSEMAKGVTEKAAQLNYMAMVSDSNRNMDYELKYLDLMIRQGVKGIIISGGGIMEEEYQSELQKRVQDARRLGIKVVALSSQGIDLPLVTVDNIQIGKTVCNFFILNNYKKIAFIGGNEKVTTNYERLLGYKIALKEKGMEIDENLIINGQFTWEAGYETCKILFDRKREIDSIFCANDNIAIGVIRFLRENKIKIPNEVSLIGVGDIPIAQYTSPSLTTVKIPFNLIGNRAVELICSDENIEDSSIYFKTQLIVRESIKIPKIS